MILEELVALLGFRVEGEQDLDRFQRGMAQAGERVGAMARDMARFGAIAAAAFAGAAAGMVRLANSAAGPLDDLGKAADRAGVSFETLQRLGFAAEQSGSSTQELAGALEMMTARLAEAARGSGRALQALDAYGISATDAGGRVKNAADFLLELSDLMQTLGTAESLDLASKLGLSGGILTMLRGGREEIEAWAAAAEDAGLIFSDDARRTAEQYNDTLNLLTRSIEALRTTVMVGLMPAMTETTEQMQAWLNANREFLAQNLGEVVESLARNITFVASGLADMDVTAMVALAAAALLVSKRLTIIAVGLTAINDVLTYLSGGEGSYFGAFVEWIQDLIPISERAAEAIGAIAVAFGTIAALSPIATGRALYSGIAALAPLIGSAFGAAFAFLATPAGWAVILAGVAAALVAYFWDDLVALWDSIEWSRLGVAIGEGILRGLESMTGAILAWFASIIPPWMLEFLDAAGGRLSAGLSQAAGATPAGVGMSASDIGSLAGQAIRGGDTNVDVRVEQTITGSGSAAADQQAAAVRAWTDLEDAMAGFGTTAPSPVQ